MVITMKQTPDPALRATLSLKARGEEKNSNHGLTCASTELKGPAGKELAEARWQKAAGVPDLPVESG